VIIPVHDIKKTQNCIKALNKQTYEKIEIIKVDFKGFPAEKRNYGFEKSHGNFILFLDEDEYLSPETIHECVKKARQGYDIVAIPVRKKVDKGYALQSLAVIRENTVKTMFFKKKVLLDIGLFDPRFIFCDDIEIRERALSREYRIGMIEHGYMLHDENVTVKSIIQKTILTRRPFRELRSKYGEQAFQRIVRPSFHRRRIVKELLIRPKYIFGVLFIMSTRAIIRRIP
jgi:glycosyltransferase involved in cell wall biosynthesis